MNTLDCLVGLYYRKVALRNFECGLYSVNLPAEWEE